MRSVLLAAMATLLPDSLPRAAFAILPGDTAADPLPISALPFSASGNTCDYAHQYDEFCPYDGQNSPDVVYAYVPPTDIVVNLSLCESGYDTKVLVYENVADSNHLYACNDDGCEGPHYAWPYLAYLRQVPLAAGNTYFFVVDGYGSSCGPYVLRISEDVSCALVCPAGGEEEGETKCVDGWDDEYDGGCDADVPAFVEIEPSHDPVVICGFTNADPLYHHRDEDWYQLSTAGPDTIVVRCEPDFAAFVTVYDGAAGCEEPLVLGYAVTDLCQAATIPVVRGPGPPGPIWIRVKPLAAGVFDCPAKYVLTVEGHEGPVEAAIPPAAILAASGALLVAPTPFVASVTIRASSPDGAWASLRIHDVSGRALRTLLDGAVPAGMRAFVWDGCDGSGRPVRPGVYFARWSDGKSVRAAKIVRASR